jgi:hypothetical protein
MIRNIVEVLRNKSLTTLSQDNHVRLAIAYNSVAARFVERSIKKPLNNIVNCGLPLVYISQPPRSGGTLLRSIFDVHPLCCVFPHELSWQKNGFHWESSLDQFKSPRSAYRLLYDRWIDPAIVRGISRKYPFHFNRQLQKKIFFDDDIQNLHPTENRIWLDKYMTSFFNAWVDYRNLYGQNNKFCIAFCPWNFVSTDEIERFYNFYPDGFRIQVIRNPLGWWASERNYGSSKKRLCDYLESRWIRSITVGMQAREMFPERYILVSFDQMIRRPEYSLTKLCAKLDLPFDRKMLVPTINEIPTTANTSFGIGQVGFDASVLDRWRSHLPEEEVDEIKEGAMHLYEESLSKCVNSE